MKKTKKTALSPAPATPSATTIKPAFKAAAADPRAIGATPLTRAAVQTVGTWSGGALGQHNTTQVADMSSSLWTGGPTNIGGDGQHIHLRHERRSHRRSAIRRLLQLLRRNRRRRRSTKHGLRRDRNQLYLSGNRLRCHSREDGTVVDVDSMDWIRQHQQLGILRDIQRHSPRPHPRCPRNVNLDHGHIGHPRPFRSRAQNKVENHNILV